MKGIRGVAGLSALFALTLSANGATLVVLNKSEHTASLIDPESGKTLAKLPVGRGPHEVIVSIDGRTAYVSNFGPYGICPAGDTMCKTPGNTITVLDLAARKVKTTYDYGTNKGQHGSLDPVNGFRVRENDPRQTFRQKCASRLTILDLRVTSRPFLIRIAPTRSIT